MASAGQFDILLQFQQTVIQDLQHRILNASPLTTLWVKSPLSRRIEQPVPPLEVKACWNSPNVTVSDGGIKLSADLNGGARQILSGRILTLDGTVSAQQMVTHAVDSERRPYVCVKAPTAIQVNLRQLKVSYEGSHWPELLAKLNPAKEATALRPVLAAELFGQLACIPLTCMPYSLPVSAPDNKRGAAVGTLPIKRIVPGLFATPASVALGLMLDDKRAAPASFAGVLLPQSRYNTAIAFSEQGLNALLTHLCDQGEAMGQVQHTRLGKIEWCWEKLRVTLRQDVLAISGLLVQQGVKLSVMADVKSKLVNNGCVQSYLVSGNVDANAAETLLASWNGVLKLLLRSRAANKRDQDARDVERLFQCFDLPASKQTVETVARELVVSGEQLIIYYTIPKSVKEFPLEFPPPKPAVTITQPHMPRQTAPVAPVTIELDAQITRDSTSPYDYAWTNDLSPNPTPQFGSKYIISSVPLKPAIGEGPQTLTTAHLKVIDMFGQVAETQAPARYLPYTQQKQQQPKKSAGSGIWVALVTLVIIVVIYAVAHGAASGGNGTSGGQQKSNFNFSFSGAVVGTLVVGTVKDCGPITYANGNGYDVSLDGTVIGASYNLGIVVGYPTGNFPGYAGPGTYGVGSGADPTGMETGTLDSTSSPSNIWLIQSGSVTVNSDVKSGSISAILWDYTDNTHVQVSGTWICP